MLLSKLRIAGHSMEPILKNNDLVLISNIFYIFKHPQINDIVAFRFDEKFFVKRITKSKNQKYFLEGDNKSDSLDSRGFGWISRNEILGKYFYKLT
jgi:signal peptidase I